MKTLRLFTIVTLAVLIISSWTPVPVHAKPSSGPSASSTNLVVDAAKVKKTKLVVNNLTGGTLYVHLSGPASYSFATAKRGKTVFTNIKPGVYTISVNTSACPGTLTYKRKINGTASLKTFICRH